MKKVLRRALHSGISAMLLLSMCQTLLLSLVTPGAAHAFQGGDGSADYPYRITTCAELQAVNNNRSAHYVLMNDINCSGYGWTPIGNFTGSLDGRNYQIWNLNVNSPSSGQLGLFASISGASVQNLSIQNEYMTGYDYVGGLAGLIHGSATISNIMINASLNGAHFVGEIAGQVDNTGGGNPTFNRVYVTGTITSNYGGYRVGGMIGGLDEGTIDNSSANVAITTNASNVGGLAGWQYIGTTITRSYSAGSINGGSSVGGLVGFSYSGPTPAVISHSFTVTTMTNSGAEHGGLVGRLYNGVTTTDDFFDGTKTASPFCDAYSTPTGCTDVNSDGSDSDHFKNGTDLDPFVTGGWDFNNDWQQTTGLPAVKTFNTSLTTLADLPAPNAPQNLQGTASGASAVTLTWGAPASNGSGDPSGYTVEYKNSSDSSWTNFETATNTTSTVTGLQPNTDYDFRVSAVTAGGTSTSDPITVHSGQVAHAITDCQGLQDMQYDLSGNFTLAQDIDCSDTQNWNSGQGFTPISNFTGSLDGQGHTISNLTIARNGASYIGLFASLEGASVSNVNFSACTVTGDSEVGLLAGTAIETTINHVTANGDVSGNLHSGGLIGFVNGTQGNVGVLNSSFSGSVRSADVETETDYMGGLIGMATAAHGTLTLSNLRAQATISGSSVASWAIGGIVGEVDTFNDGITNATSLSASGEVSGGGEALGGLIGADYTYFFDGDSPGVLNLTRSHANPDITGSDMVGGLIGLSNNAFGGATNISKSYATSDALATGYSAGGIVGDIENDSNGSSTTIDQVYAAGSTNVSTDNGGGDAGGLVGYADTNNSLSITNSYNEGIVTAYHYVGGLLGEGDANISNSYSRGSITTGIDEAAGGLVGNLWFGLIVNSFATGGISVTTTSGNGSVGGLIGQGNGSESALLLDNYFAPNLTYQNHCVGNGDFGECAAQNVDEGSPDYYYVHTNDPLINWDFANIWMERSGDYPVLAFFDTQNTPLIRNCIQLQAISNNPSASYTLANDIDCSDTPSWNNGDGFQPITNFSGQLDGAGHTISGLYEHRVNSSEQGIFANLQGGFIHDVNIDAADITAWDTSGALVGIIDGDTGGGVNNVHVTGSTVRGRYDIGGLVGEVYAHYSEAVSMVTNSSSAGLISQRNGGDTNQWGIGGLIGTVSAAAAGNLVLTGDSSTANCSLGNSSAAIGGLVGRLEIYDHSNATVHDLSASGNISAPNSSQVGGLIGSFEVNSNDEARYTFARLSASGNLSGGNTNQGGLIGELDSYTNAYVSLRGASATGNVDMASFNGAPGGGLIGELYATGGRASVRQSYATGNVYAPNSSWVGGLIGETDGGTIVIANTYATGNVTGGWQTGGLLGAVDAMVANSYASGVVTSSSGTNVGGFAGWIGHGLVKNSFSTGLVTGADGNTDVSGFIGGYRNTTLQNNYYDYTASNQPNCSENDGWQINNNLGECTLVNGDNGDAGHFLGNNSNVPLDTWNFDSIWQTNDSALPTLQPLSTASIPNAPTNLAGSGDKNNLVLTWDAPTYFGSPLVAYRVEAQSPVDSRWVTIGITTSDSLQVDPQNIFDYGTYNFRVTAVTEEGDSEPSGRLIYDVGVHYQISTCEDLQNINQDLTGIYTLANDIDCSDTVYWNDGYGFEPIGLNDGYFHGTLDGQGHKITGLFMDRSSYDGDRNAGLFYTIEGATLANFTLYNGSITGDYSAGALAAYAYNSQTSNVYSNLPVTSLNGGEVGGLYGELYADSGLAQATIIRSVSTGDVTGYSDVGGLVGYIDNNVYIGDSFYRGSVTGQDWDVGGLVGYSDGKLNVQNAYAAGTVTGYDAVGGIAGGMGQDDSSLTNVFAAETLNYQEGDYVGYIVGNWWSATTNTTNVYYDEAGNADAVSCTNRGASSGCTGVNGEGSQPGYFFGNTTNPPLNAWDFEGTWVSQADDYPLLQGFEYNLTLHPPVLNDSGITSSRVFLRWNAAAGADHYQVQYKLSSADDSGWNDYNHPSQPTGTSLVVNGLTHDTSYDFRIKSWNADESVSSAWSNTYSVTTGGQAYAITNCDQLQDIQGDPSGNYTLLNDIDCADTAAWNGGSGFWPIAYENWDNPFTGTLDGNGYAIKDLTIDRSGGNDDSSGLFYRTNGATISNLAFNGGSISSRNSAGAVAAFANNTAVENVSSNMLVQTMFAGQSCTGGLIGCMQADTPGGSQLISSYSTGETDGYTTVGGLVGWSSNGVVSRSYALGDVNGDFYVGGLVGFDSDSSVNDSYTRNNVWGTGMFVGGLIGAALNADVISTYASGQVGTAASQVGGLIGDSQASLVQNSFSTASVSGPDATTSGGLIGWALDDTTLVNDYWDQAVSGIASCSGPVSGANSSDCYAVNQNGDDPGHFVNTTTVAPLNSWDFASVWAAHSSQLPTLAGAPVLEGEITAKPTAHSISVHWQFDPNGSPLTSTTLQYRKQGDTTWTAIDVAADATTAEATGLLPSTPYEFQLLAQNSLGTSRQYGFVALTTAENSPSQTTPVVTTVTVSRPKIAAGAQTLTEQNDGKSNKTAIYLDTFTDYTHGSGQRLSLQVGDVIHFTLRRHGRVENHTATVKAIGKDYIVLTIASTPFDMRVNLGETKTVSIAGQAALKVNLADINNGRADIIFSRLSPNKHSTTAVYQSSSHQSGTAIALLMVLALAILLAVAKRRNPKSTRK